MPTSASNIRCKEDKEERLGKTAAAHNTRLIARMCK